MQSYTKDQYFESLDLRYTSDSRHRYEITCEKAGELVKKKLVGLLSDLSQMKVRNMVTWDGRKSVVCI